MASLPRTSLQLSRRIKVPTTPAFKRQISQSTCLCLSKSYPITFFARFKCVRSTQLPNTSFLARFFGSKPSTMSIEAAKKEAQSIIDNNKIAVFSKSYCPYCRAAKSLLTSLDAKMIVVELDKREDGSALQDALQEISGQRTVPNIFLNGKHIGGNSDLQAMKDELPKILKDLGATQ